MYIENSKGHLKLESYLTGLPKVSARYICKYRTRNHRLPIVTGRYLKLERNRRVCNLCDNGDLGDKCHYLFLCKDKDLIFASQKATSAKILLEEYDLFKYSTLMGEISSKMKLSRLVSVFCKEIVINVKQ